MSKNKKIIIGSAIAAIAIIITTLVVCINVSLSQRCGYHDILEQLENGTYVNPTSGDYIVNDAGWIIKIQQVENAMPARFNSAFTKFLKERGVG